MTSEAAEEEPAGSAVVLGAVFEDSAVVSEKLVIISLGLNERVV